MFLIVLHAPLGFERGGHSYFKYLTFLKIHVTNCLEDSTKKWVSLNLTEKEYAVKKPLFWGIHADPRQNSLFASMLALLPFIGMAFVWWITSSEGDRFFPTFMQMYEAMAERLTVDEFAVDDPSALGFWESLRHRVLVADVYHSVYRLTLGTLLAAVFGLAWGLYLGSFPGLRQTFGTFTVFVSLVVVAVFQPLIVSLVGFDNFGKISLIAFGTVFFIALSTFQAVKNVPEELKVSALTLGFTPMGMIHRVILPLIIPHWLTAIRFALLIAWTFLIMSEFISSEHGLGHEVFKSKRQLQMYVIIPYGLIATMLAFIMDRVIRQIIIKCYPHFHIEE